MTLELQPSPPSCTARARAVDARRAATDDLLAALHARFAGAEFTAAEVSDDPAFGPLLAACGSQTSGARSVGCVLARRADRTAFLRATPVVEPPKLPAGCVAIEEQERAPQLVLRHRRNVAFDREARQKVFDVDRPELCPTAVTMEPDEPPDPVRVDLLGPDAVTFAVDAVAQTSSRCGDAGGDSGGKTDGPG